MSLPNDPSILDPKAQQRADYRTAVAGNPGLTAVPLPGGGGYNPTEAFHIYQNLFPINGSNTGDVDPNYGNTGGSSGDGGGGYIPPDHFFDVNPLDQAKFDQATQQANWQNSFDQAQFSYKQAQDAVQAALAVGDQAMARQKQADANYWQGQANSLQQQGLNLQNQGQQNDYNVAMQNIAVQTAKAQNDYNVGMANASNDAERNRVQSQWNQQQALISQMQDQTQRLGLQVQQAQGNQDNATRLGLGQQQNQTGQFNAETARADSERKYLTDMANATTESQRAAIDEARRQDEAHIAQMEDQTKFTLGQQANQTQGFDAQTARLKADQDYRLGLANASNDAERVSVEDKRRQDEAAIAQMEDKTRFDLGQQANQIQGFDAETARQKADQDYQIGMANARTEAEKSQIEDKKRRDDVAIANMAEGNKFTLGQQANQTGQFGAETDRAARMGDLAMQNNKFILDASGQPRNLWALAFMARGQTPDWDAIQADQALTQGAKLQMQDPMHAYDPVTGPGSFNATAQQATAQGASTWDASSPQFQPGYTPTLGLPGFNQQHTGVTAQPGTGWDASQNPYLNNPDTGYHPDLSLPGFNDTHQGVTPVAGPATGPGTNPYLNGTNTPQYQPTTQAPNFNLTPGSGTNVAIPDSQVPIVSGSSTPNPYTSAGPAAVNGPAPITNQVPMQSTTPVSGPPPPGPSHQDINPGGSQGGVPVASLHPGMNLSTVGGNTAIHGSDFSKPAYYDEAKTQPIQPGDTVNPGVQVWVDNGTPQMAAGGYTTAPQFVTGDHPSGIPTGNEELTQLGLTTENGYIQPTAKVIPLNPANRPINQGAAYAAAQNSPRFALGTDAQRNLAMGYGLPQSTPGFGAGRYNSLMGSQMSQAQPRRDAFSAMRQQFANRNGFSVQGPMMDGNPGMLDTGSGVSMPGIQTPQYLDNPITTMPNPVQGSGGPITTMPNPYKGSGGGMPVGNIPFKPAPVQGGQATFPGGAPDPKYQSPPWAPPQQSGGATWGGDPIGGQAGGPDDGWGGQQKQPSVPMPGLPSNQPPPGQGGGATWGGGSGGGVTTPGWASPQPQAQPGGMGYGGGGGQPDNGQRTLGQNNSGSTGQSQWGGTSGLPHFAMGTGMYGYPRYAMGTGQPELSPRLQQLAAYGVPITPGMAATSMGSAQGQLNMANAYNQRGGGVVPSLQGLNNMSKDENDLYQGYVNGPVGIGYNTMTDWLGKPTQNLGRAQQARVA